MNEIIKKNKTEQLKDSWTLALLMFRQEQVSLEGALRMLVLACKEAGLKFAPDELNLTYIKRPSTPDSVWWEQTKEAISKDINLQIEELEL